MRIPIVENPRRRRRHRRLSPAQIAAGFGGKRRRSPSRRRRNPGLSTYFQAGNPRRRRARVHNPRRHRSRRRYHNPAGFLGSLTSGHTLKTAGGMAVGIVLSKYVPSNLITKVWAGVPTTGIGGAAVRVGVGVLASELTRRFLKQSEIANGMLVGVLGYELYQLAAQYVLPSLGLSGMGEYRLTTTQRPLSISTSRSSSMGGMQQVEPALSM